MLNRISSPGIVLLATLPRRLDAGAVMGNGSPSRVSSALENLENLGFLENYLSSSKNLEISGKNVSTQGNFVFT